MQPKAYVHVEYLLSPPTHAIQTTGRYLKVGTSRCAVLVWQCIPLLLQCLLEWLGAYLVVIAVWCAGVCGVVEGAAQRAD